MGGQCVKINEDIFEYLPEGREEGRRRWVYGDGVIGLSLTWWGSVWKLRTWIRQHPHEGNSWCQKQGCEQTAWKNSDSTVGVI